METKASARIMSALRCFVGLHNIPENATVTEMGAVFLGGICTRCFEVKVGKFLCNYWDDSQTETKDGVTHLSGINPILTNGNYLPVDLDFAQEFAENLRSKKKKKDKADT